MPAAEAASPDDVSRELKTLTPLVEPLAARIEELRTELAVLPRYIEPLRRLLPLVPELAELDESEIQALQLEAVALVLNTGDETVVDVLREALRTELGDRFVLVAARVDSDAIGCVIVTPRSAAEGVQAVLGRERVRPLPLPSRYENLSFRGAVTAMESRLREIPGRARPGAGGAARAARAARGGVASGAPATPGRHRTARSRGAGRARRVARSSIVGWTPRERVPELRVELERAAGGELVLDELSTPPEVEPPVLMRNRKLARPFEFLVRFLDLPRSGSLDPTDADGAVPAADGRRDGGRRRLRDAAARHRALRAATLRRATRRRFAI